MGESASLPVLVGKISLGKNYLNSTSWATFKSFNKAGTNT